MLIRKLQQNWISTRASIPVRIRTPFLMVSTVEAVSANMAPHFLTVTKSDIWSRNCELVRHMRFLYQNVTIFAVSVRVELAFGGAVNIHL